MRSMRPSPALVVAGMALFISLGGVSYAVATGSIDSREIKDNTIRSKDMRSGSITAREVRRRSLDGTDIKVNRVGGNAVKEEGLESGKIRKVPSAAQADNATNSANAANAANSAAVGGRSAGQLATRWALVNEAGAIEAQSGGFSTVDCYQTNANCYLNAGEDVRDQGMTATISVANTDATPVLSGETGVAACGATSVACAPPNTENNNVLVVAPRNSAGAAFPAGDTARFYVFVTGS
jgi:hypothetical protein